jgi:hypothetical protein
MTTFTVTQLLPPTALGTSDVAVYSPPTLTTAKITRAVFANNTASAATITAGKTSGGTLGTLAVIPILTIAPNSTYIASELIGMVLPAGWSLHAFSGTASAIELEVDGYLIR